MTALVLSDLSCVLFVPGHRPDRFDKARAASPDGIVIDLEDAVPLAEKDAARAVAADYAAGAGHGPIVLVRLNPLGTRAALDDLAAVADGRLAPAGILLAKVETPRDIEIVRDYSGALPLLAAVETARGLDAAPEIAAALRPGEALGFGGADFAADTGAAFAWEPLYAARTALVAAARRRVGVFDVPRLDINDTTALVDETRRVRALGFTGKIAIHPAQVATIRAAFQPTADEIDRARRIVVALDAAGGGAAAIDGRMIDAPVAIDARRTLSRANVTGQAPDQRSE